MSDSQKSFWSVWKVAFLVPLALGGWSLWRGQDSNWDLLNYHGYNGFAAWHGKRSIDFAAAGMQTWFNPALDLVYYGLWTILPAPWVGFLLGALQGLIVIPILWLGQRALANQPEPTRTRAVIGLAIAGVLTANFLSGLGNTMGDNLTAVLVVSALWAGLVATDVTAPRIAGRSALLALSGALIGLSIGLKLTNAVFGLALAMVLAAAGAQARPGPEADAGAGLKRCLTTMLWFGGFAAIGFAMTGGYWHLSLWREWGNPVFPQFSSLFPHPFVPQVGVVDAVWHPKGIAEYLSWPFVISADATRVGQLPLRQVIWAVAYACLLAALVGLALHRPARKRAMADSPPIARRLVAFVVLSFVLWMIVFSIYRYLVANEVLLPLFILIVLQPILPSPSAIRWTRWLVIACTVYAVGGGVRHWGSEGWATSPFRVELPALTEPERTTVLLAVGDPPLAWIASNFPVAVAFTQTELNFPVTPAFTEHQRRFVRDRGGPVFAVIDARHHSRIKQVERLQRLVVWLGLDQTDARCAMLASIVKRLRLRADFEPKPTTPAAPYCQLGLRPEDRIDLAAENRALAQAASQRLAARGYVMNPDRCVTLQAYVGDGPRPYQWCPVALTPA